ncbi:DUF2584 family protein [Candidatus Woesearchaeota archaeon]|nr:DUF2584 family protein [Candidatus Woesearchaeota archaeon]
MKLKPEQGLNEQELEENKTYLFNKKEERVYPINIPIDLVNQDWEVIAKVLIKEITIKQDQTNGKFFVLKKYSNNERKFLTDNLKETRKYKRY